MHYETKICTLDNRELKDPKSCYPQLVKFIGANLAGAFVKVITIPLAVPLRSEDG